MTCSLFVIHSVLSKYKEICCGRMVYKTQPFSRRLHVKISRTDSKGCEESGPGCSVSGGKGVKEQAGSLTLQMPETQ